MSVPAPDDLTALRAAFATGELTPAQHVGTVLERLRRDRHNVVIALDEARASADAETLGTELRRHGPRGPLHGVAVGVKDLVDVAGLPTRAGSAVRADASPAGTDAAVVARLRRAGAVVVGKLHTHEFGLGPTGDVAVTGAARNPHDPGRITGGSSSGPACAVAAGHLPLAVGTDTGGSVRIPAALCGVLGLKPARGTLPTRGVLAVAPSLDHVGLLAADPSAALAGWEALVGASTRPPAGPPRPLRVGLPRDEYWTQTEPVVSDAVARAASALEAAGCRVTTVATPLVRQLAETYMPILAVEAHAVHADTVAERGRDYQTPTAVDLGSFAEYGVHDHERARRTARRLTARLTAQLADVDVLLTPTTRVRATPLNRALATVGDARTTVAAALLDLTLPFNLLGWPALSVPAPGDGLPVGLQLVSTGGDEHVLLDLARILWPQMRPSASIASATRA
ncbi:amidase [Pseudonocardia endophytica]|uniref:Aspartyl-tRNA(Asn)/glutamyl-tRNA(Gln) amidotransferase subunit A n=1 Tax=Pseudonocardia endophytica TaxID=401976 RepID=A0A4R1HXT7_PSEEN|nr:amidase [Pseudonocardia endophytica]TCK26311.1 aspartyl-tRNA(Asn)/glutamyl-tRNA(Gln) amidotransferase subunit A [Pseudonocardia endophytica]